MTWKRRLIGVLVLALAACTGTIEGASLGGRAPAADLNGDGIPDGVAPGTAAPGTGPGAGAGGAGANPGATPAGTLVAPSATLRRLTLTQYRNSVRDLLGLEADVSALTQIPSLNGLQAIAASTVALPERDLETFESLADTLSEQTFADSAGREKLVGCDAQQAACAESFVTSFGRRALRRPLTEDERMRYLGLLRTATQMTADGWLGLRVVMSALLQSPGFLYREELGTPDPADPARRLLTPYEVASRLSFFVWNTTPDVELLDAAQDGSLASDAGLRAQADRLLASPRAATAIEELVADYLQLDALDALVKLPEIFPQATATLAAAMKQETLRSLRALLFERGDDFRDAFTTTRTFADAELAELYDIPGPSGGTLAPVELPASGPRAGLLTQASFLALHAHPGSSSPTLRGKFIRENLMCQGLPPPPDDVDTTLPDTSEAPTMRDRLTRHREDTACAGCHSLMDPIGLALENFDALGTYRRAENGTTIDASGELDGVTFTDARGLGAALGAHPQVGDCFARTLLRYARGALESASEEPRVAALNEAFAAAGYRMPELMRQIATDPSFRHVGALQ